MYVHINVIIGSILLLVALAEFGLLIFFSRYVRTITIWSYLGFIAGVILWVGANAVSFFQIEGDITSLQKFAYFGGTIFVSSFLVFAHSFPYPVHKLINTLKYYPLVASAFFAYLLFGSNHFFPTGHIVLQGNYMSTTRSAGLMIWTIFFLVTWALAVYALVHRYRQPATTQKRRIYYLLIGIAISSIIGIATDVIMPYFAIQHHAWIGPLFSVVWIWFTVKAVRTD